MITEEALNTKCTLHTKDTSKDKEEDKKKPSANGDISGGDASGDNSSKEDTPPAEPQSTLNIPNMGNVSFPDTYRQGLLP